MGTFTVQRTVAAPAADVWALLMHWPNHGRWVPLTRVRTTSASAAGVGATFVGRSGLGPLSFDDPMMVTAWQPPGQSPGQSPGRCEIHKTGRVVLGDAWFTVTPLDSARCTVQWSETIQVAALRRLPLVGRVTDLVGRLTFAAAVRAMAAEAEAAAPAGRPRR